MRIGIVYYSRSGNTREIAEILCRKLRERNADAEMIEIKTAKKVGFLQAFLVSIQYRNVPLENIDYDLSKYDVVVVGTPIWIGRPSPIVETFMKNTEGLGLHGRRVFVFATCSRNPDAQGGGVELIKNVLKKHDAIVDDVFLVLKMRKREIIKRNMEIDDFIENIISA